MMLVRLGAMISAHLFMEDKMPAQLFDRPHVFTDTRGRFHEVFSGAKVPEGVPTSFKLVNHVRTRPRVLRGMHYQHPRSMGKFVTCLSGNILDVVVDLRPDSASFKKWWSFRLSEGEEASVWVPRGFAHGFYVLGDAVASVLYLGDEVYHAADDQVVRWNDPELGIDWPNKNPDLSVKDRDAPLLKDIPADKLPSAGL